MPAVLKKAGYTSGIFGKWDLGQLKRFLPLARGFDDFYGFANTGIDYFTHERYGVPSMRRGNQLTEEDKATYCTDLFQREALRFIEENGDKPFFLYVPFNAPHGASNLDREIRGKAQAVPKYMAMYPEPTNKRDRHLTTYKACVTHMDAAIGKILDRIEKDRESQIAAKPAVCETKPAVYQTEGKMTNLKRIARINTVIESIRPQLQADHGDVELVEVTDKAVYVNMTGACTNCQLSSATLAGIQQRLIEELGEFIKVVPASQLEGAMA